MSDDDGEQPPHDKSRDSGAAPFNDDERRRRLALVARLTDQLHPASIAELERALALLLKGEPNGAERRWRELGLLATLLDEAAGDGAVSYLPREVYDKAQARVPDAPTSGVLVERYGLHASSPWKRVCWRAYTLKPDGRKTDGGQPWRAGYRRQDMPAAYELWEIREAIRTCAFAIGRVPSSTDYGRWVSATRRRMRDRGQPPPRLPTFRSIYRHYPHGTRGQRWRQILADSGITLEKVAKARQQWIPGADGPLIETGSSVVQAVAALDSWQRQTIPLTDAEWQLVAAGRCGELPVERAGLLAAVLKKPLEWLAGGSDLAAPPKQPLRFSGSRYLSQRRKAGVAAADIQSALGLRRGEYRKLTQGTLPVTLNMAERIAAMLDVPIEALCE